MLEDRTPPAGAGEEPVVQAGSASVPEGASGASPGGKPPRRTIIRQIRDKLRDKQWVKKVGGPLAFIVTAVIIGMLILTKSGWRVSQLPGFPRERKPSAAAAPTVERPVTVFAQPVGEIKDLMPSEVVFKAGTYIRGEYYSTDGKHLISQENTEEDTIVVP